MRIWRPFIAWIVPLSMLSFLLPATLVSADLNPLAEAAIEAAEAARGNHDEVTQPPSIPPDDYNDYETDYEEPVTEIAPPSTEYVENLGSTERPGGGKTKPAEGSTVDLDGLRSTPGVIKVTENGLESTPGPAHVTSFDFESTTRAHAAVDPCIAFTQNFPSSRGYGSSRSLHQATDVNLSSGGPTKRYSSFTRSPEDAKQGFSVNTADDAGLTPGYRIESTMRHGGEQEADGSGYPTNAYYPSPGYDPCATASIPFEHSSVALEASTVQAMGSSLHHNTADFVRSTIQALESTKLHQYGSTPSALESTMIHLHASTPAALETPKIEEHDSTPPSNLGSTQIQQFGSTHPSVHESTMIHLHASTPAALETPKFEEHGSASPSALASTPSNEHQHGGSSASVDHLASTLQNLASSGSEATEGIEVATAEPKSTLEAELFTKPNGLATLSGDVSGGAPDHTNANAQVETSPAAEIDATTGGIDMAGETTQPSDVAETENGPKPTPTWSSIPPWSIKTRPPTKPSSASSKAPNTPPPTTAKAGTSSSTTKATTTAPTTGTTAGTTSKRVTTKSAVVASTTSAPEVEGECNGGYALLKKHVNLASAGAGKFSGYFSYVSSCAELCTRDIGVSCEAFSFEPASRGRCTLYQYEPGEIETDPASTASLYHRC